MTIRKVFIKDCHKVSITMNYLAKLLCNTGGRSMISILFIGMIVSLFIILSYALCRASDEADRMFGYKTMSRDHEMTHEGDDKNLK